MGRPKPEEAALAGKDPELGPFPWGSFGVALGAAVLGVGVWVGGIYLSIALLPPLAVGALVGLSVWWIDRGDSRMPWAAAGLTLVACWAGYALGWLIFWQKLGLAQPPGVGFAIRNFLSDIQSLVLALISAYLAWVLAGRAGKASGGGLAGGGG
ncbi:MAG: hypothetical protein AAF823_15265 [Planctomycetota bacterium]